MPCTVNKSVWRTKIRATKQGPHWSEMDALTFSVIAEVTYTHKSKSKGHKGFVLLQILFLLIFYFVIL